MSSIVLFDDNKSCCGCGACMNVCPENAIMMEEDEFGFLYPKINAVLCVECGACKKVCNYQNSMKKFDVKTVYAASAKDHEILKKSTSGGLFAVIAKSMLQNGGVVYGAALPFENGKLTPKHIRISQIEDLIQLQGSKYVQSEIGWTYQQARKDLAKGQQVLFSGTPCQIAGLKKYLKKDYDNLLVVEIICHGVPNKRFFQDFMCHYGKKLGGTVRKFYFRDKSKGQGKITRCVYMDGSGNQKEKVEIGGLLAYIHFFAKSYTFRESCYNCPYATAERIADITLGDFWGFHEEYPNYNEPEGLTNGKGISCLLVNSTRGQLVVNEISNDLILMESAFDKVAKHNEQLNTPSKNSPMRETILELYKNEGYVAVDRYFYKNFKKDILKYKISGMLPKEFKRMIKKLLAKSANNLLKG